MPAADPRASLGLLCAAAFMASLDLFIVNVAFPSIEHDLGRGSLADVSWVLNAYAIIYAALLIPAGRLADRYGRRGAFMLGVAVFTLASAGCAAAPSLWALIAFRALQAAGAAILTPASLGLVLATFPGPAGARAVRIWAAAGALAAAAGPVVGGALVQADWRWVFIVNVPIGVVALLLSPRLLIPSRDPHVTRLPDLPGAGLLAVAIGLLALGLVKGADWGWESPATLVCLVAPFPALVGLFVRGRHHPVPVIEPAILAVRSFSWANATAVAFAAAFGANLLITILWLQQVWHWSPITTGLAVAPGPLTVIPFTVLAHRLQPRIGSGRLTALGCLLLAVSIAYVTLAMGLHSAYTSEILPGVFVSGAGTGLALPEILAASTSTLPISRTATGSAIINMSRQIGTVLGVSIAVAIIATPHTGPQALDAFRDARWALTAAATLGALLALGMTPRQPGDISVGTG